MKTVFRRAQLTLARFFDGPSVTGTTDFESKVHPEAFDRPAVIEIHIARVDMA